MRSRSDEELKSIVDINYFKSKLKAELLDGNIYCVHLFTLQMGVIMINS